MKVRDSVTTPYGSGIVIRTPSSKEVQQHDEVDTSNATTATSTCCEVKLAFGMLYITESTLDMYHRQDEERQLQASFAGLEKMRKFNLQLSCQEKGIVIDDDSKLDYCCSTCILGSRSSRSCTEVDVAAPLEEHDHSGGTNDLFLFFKRWWILHQQQRNNKAILYRKGKACLLCGSPSCREHSSSSSNVGGNNRNINVCIDCHKIMSADDFVIDQFISSTRNERQALINRLLEIYDRAMLLLQYSFLLQRSSGAAVSEEKKNSNPSTSCHLQQQFFQHLFDDNNDEEPMALATIDHVLALYGMVQSILRITCILDALLRCQIQTNLNDPGRKRINWKKQREQFETIPLFIQANNVNAANDVVETGCGGGPLIWLADSAMRLLNNNKNNKEQQRIMMEQMKKVDPYELMKQIQDEIEYFPSTSELEIDCDNFLSMFSRQQERSRAEEEVAQFLLKQAQDAGASEPSSTTMTPTDWDLHHLERPLNQAATTPLLLGESFSSYSLDSVDVDDDDYDDVSLFGQSTTTASTSTSLSLLERIEIHKQREHQDQKQLASQ